VAEVGNLRIGVVSWFKERDGIACAISSTINEMGHSAVNFAFDSPLPRQLDAVIAYGPLGSFLPIAKQIACRSRRDRPLLAWWLTEQFPSPRLPEWLLYPIATLRSYAERSAFYEAAPGQWRIRSRLSWIAGKGPRFRYYGDLFWLRRAGLLSILAVPSPWIAAFLRRRGFDPVVTYFGSHPEWGRPLDLDRDVPVLWLGKPGTRRRATLLRRIRGELERRNIPVFVVDGIEHPFVHGEERTILLNRTRIALNLLRREWDDNSLRFYLAAANGALIVTEPTLPHCPFEPGVHLVESPVEKMAETIRYYLSHEQERARIAESARELVSKELTMNRALSPILERIRSLKQKTP